MKRGELITLYGSGTGVLTLTSEWFATDKDVIAPGKGNQVKIWSIIVTGTDPVRIQITDDYTASSPTWKTVLEIKPDNVLEPKLPIKILTSKTGKEAFRVNVAGTTGSTVILNVEIAPSDD